MIQASDIRKVYGNYGDLWLIKDWMGAVDYPNESDIYDNRTPAQHELNMVQGDVGEFGTNKYAGTEHDYFMKRINHIKYDPGYDLIFNNLLIDVKTSFNKNNPWWLPYSETYRDHIYVKCFLNYWEMINLGLYDCFTIELYGWCRWDEFRNNYPNKDKKGNYGNIIELDKLHPMDELFPKRNMPKTYVSKPGESLPAFKLILNKEKEN
jgi:hypothetical protein